MHGGIGYSRHKPFEHIYRHHRRYRITEGSEEIQIRKVAAYLFGYAPGPKRREFEALGIKALAARGSGTSPWRVYGSLAPSKSKPPPARRPFRRSGDPAWCAAS